jgi:DNA-binding MarR family transcriptional regulator
LTKKKIKDIINVLKINVLRKVRMKEQTFRTAEQQTVRLLMLTDRLHRAAIETQIEKLGIHRSQHFVLMSLSHRNGEFTQTEIANMLDISPAAVTVTLQKLEKAGLIERQTSKNDARTKIIRLTQEGKKTVKKTHELFLEVDDTMCGGMTEKELDSLCAYLSRMTENLKAAGHKDPCDNGAGEDGKQ